MMTPSSPGPLPCSRLAEDSGGNLLLGAEMNVMSFRLTNHLHLSNHRTAFSAVETNNHKCRHLHQDHPAAKLAPFKLGNLSKHVPVPETLRQFQH